MSARIARAAAVVLVVAGGLYLSYELGRYEAGFSLLDARREAASMAAERADTQQTIEDLERQIAILKTSRDVDKETYADVEANLAELQAKIQSQEEELVFYRGIVSPGDGVAGLRIQNVEVSPGDGEATLLLRVQLVQAIVHNDRLTGSIRATLKGTLAGEAASYGLDELGVESPATDIPYGFKYFQTIEVGLKPPEGFMPAELEIQVWPRSPKGETIVQSFPWETVWGDGE